jgi:hypothetical protein
MRWSIPSTWLLFTAVGCHTGAVRTEAQSSGAPELQEAALVVLRAIDWPRICPPHSCRVIMLDSAIRYTRGPAFVPSDQQILGMLDSNEILRLSGGQREFLSRPYRVGAIKGDTASIAIARTRQAREGRTTFVVVINAGGGVDGHWFIADLQREGDSWKVVATDIVES